MKKTPIILSLLLVMSLSACASIRPCCKELRSEQALVASTAELKKTSLTYVINYAPDYFDVVAKYDILFFPGDSSTNGATAYIRGKYDEPVKSDELYLRGTNQLQPSGGLNGFVQSKRKFYLTGVIRRPDTEEIRQRNNKALSIHVEENYEIDYTLQ